MQICWAPPSCVFTRRTFIPHFHSSVHCTVYLMTLSSLYFQLPPRTELTFYGMRFQNIWCPFFAFSPSKSNISGSCGVGWQIPSQKSLNFRWIHLSWSQFLLANSLCERVLVSPVHTCTYVCRQGGIRVCPHAYSCSQLSRLVLEMKTADVNVCVWYICRVAHEWYTCVGQR